MRRRIAEVVLVAAVLAALLPLTEAGWRIFPLYAPIQKDPDPRCGGKYFPLTFYRYTKEGYSTGHVNSHGLRGPDYDFARMEGTRRVEFFGDSFVEGMQVDASRTCTARLEEILDREPGGIDWQVLNMARSGDSTVQSYLFWRDEGERYHPDIVLVWINGEYSFLNSVRETALEPDARAFVSRAGGLRIEAPFAADFDSPFFRLVHDSPARWLKRSAFYNFLYWRLHLLKMDWAPARVAGPAPRMKNAGASLLEWPLGPKETEIWSLMFDFLAKFRDEVRGSGAEFVAVFNAPSNRPATPLPGRRYDPLETERRILEDLALLGVRTINLAPDFRAPEADAYFIPSPSGRRGHWNDEGHRVAGEAIARELIAAGLAGSGAAPAGRTP